MTRRRLLGLDVIVPHSRCGPGQLHDKTLIPCQHTQLFVRQRPGVWHNDVKDKYITCGSPLLR